jgi:hypothetical protein
VVETLHIPDDLLGSHSLAELGGRFRFHTTLFDRLVDGLRGEEWHVRAGEGDSAYRVLVHLVLMRRELLRVVGRGGPEPEWAHRFTSSDVVRRAAADAPAPDELVGDFRGAAPAIARALRELPAAAREALDPDRPPDLLAFVGFLCFDESFHLGQLALIRDQLGKRSVV